MTKITFFVEQNHYLGFSAQGHTGYSIKGKDIVCAAVSTLLQHTARALMKHSKAVVTRKDGFIDVRISQPNKISEVFFRELHESLLDLQSQFPSNLSLEVKTNENRNTVVRS